jgi:hypothetical protein
MTTARMFFNVGQHRRKLVDLCGFVLTRALFQCFLVNLPMQPGGGGNRTRGLSSASYSIAFGSQIFSQFDLHLGRCLKRHWI